MRRKILMYAYNHYTNQETQMCYVPFNQIGTDSSTIINCFNNLEADGYISIKSRANAAYLICLTEKGLSFCEETF